MPNEIGPSTPFSELVEYLKPEYPDEIRLKAIVFLGEKKDDQAIKPLGEILTTDPFDGARLRAIGAMKQINLVAAVPYLLQAAVDPDEEVRKAAVYELVGSLKDENPETYRQTLTALKNATSSSTLQILIAGLLDDHKQNIHEGLAFILGKTGELEAVEGLGKALTQDQDMAVRQVAATALGEMQDAKAIEYLRVALKKEDEISVHFNCIAALRNIGTPDVVPYLGEILNDSQRKKELREQAANALGWMKGDEIVPLTIPFLCQALVDKFGGVNQTAEFALIKLVAYWQLKTEKTLELLKDSGQQRSQIDALSIAKAISPPQDNLQDQKLFTNLLIQKAIEPDNSNQRMISLIAAILIASLNENMGLAGERVNDYVNNLPEIDENVEKNTLSLRIEIGGVDALAPLLRQLEDKKELENRLKESFQEPITRLNDSTHQRWETTIKHAELGFRARIYMSVTTFILGVGLVVVSFIQVMFGNLTAQELLGPGVSFATGIGAMLISISSGPLKEIHKSVNDLGIANAAFIAYVHRVLQISHTFSFYYRQQTITFEEMTKSSKLIEEAMNSTVRNLSADQINLLASSINPSEIKPQNSQPN